MAKKHTIKYRRTLIYFDENPRTGVCLFDDGAKKTDMHHWRFEFPTKQVKKNPELAKKNAVECCMRHHNLANALRKVAEGDLSEMIVLMSTMDSETLNRFTRKIVWLHFYAPGPPP